MSVSPRKSSTSGSKQRTGRLPPEARLSIALAGITCVVAAAYLYSTSLLHVPEMVDPVGPTTFPYLIGICLLLCAAGLLFEGVSKRLGRLPSQDVSEKKPLSDYLVSVGTIVWTLIYFSAFDRVGYVVSTAVFLLGLMSLFHRGFHITNLFVSVGFAIVSYGLFTRFFEVVLPPGPFFGGVL
jgi:putative tricarboxylic transport membrane protein